MIKQKIGIIGAGHLGQALVEGLLDSKTLCANQIWVSNRSLHKLQKIKAKFQVQTVDHNEELICACDTIIVCVKPQDFLNAIEPLANFFEPTQILMSLAAGVSIATIKKLVPKLELIVRLMPNSPIEIRKAVIGYCLSAPNFELEDFVNRLWSPLGYMVVASEGESFEALTVSCASGTGFVFELMQYWQEWLEEHGFDPMQAREMTVQTFLGASLLADKSHEDSLISLQEKVTSKKGVTFVGLESMRELEIERALRYSFEKAVLRDRELGKVT